MSMLINKLACKKYALEVSQTNRNGKFTRVSSDVYDHLEGILRQSIINFVKDHPSIGVTLMCGSKQRKSESE